MAEQDDGLNGFFPLYDANGGNLPDGRKQKAKEAVQSDPAYVAAESKGHKLELYHIPSGKTMVFKAYITDWQDKYDSGWNSTDVYGRMDPIMQYQGTKRVISLDWVVPSVSTDEAMLNHQKLALLASMLYPNYDVDDAPFSSATQISTSPVFKVKFANLIQDPSVANDGTSGDAADGGLVGVISGFTYAPEMADGFIDPAYGVLYPKTTKLSMEFTVLHTFALGWAGQDKRTPSFPYSGAKESQDDGGWGGLFGDDDDRDEQEETFSDGWFS